MLEINELKWQILERSRDLTRAPYDGNSVFICVHGDVFEAKFLTPNSDEYLIGFSNEKSLTEYWMGPYGSKEPYDLSRLEEGVTAYWAPIEKELKICPNIQNSINELRKSPLLDVLALIRPPNLPVHNHLPVTGYWMQLTSIIQGSVDLNNQEGILVKTPGNKSGLCAKIKGQANPLWR